MCVVCVGGGGGGELPVMLGDLATIGLVTALRSSEQAPGWVMMWVMWEREGVDNRVWVW